MKNKYVEAIKNKEINSRTGEVWKVDDVPNIWKAQVIEQLQADGYIILHDGTAEKPTYTREYIDSLKSAGLKELAKKYGITGYSSMTVAELKSALMELV